MTMAGLNMRFDIWRMDDNEDDYVGGNVVTGTVVYQYIQGRLQGFMPRQVFNDQGLETTRTYTVTLVPGTLDVRERDEVEVVAPFDHQFFGDRFRLQGILPSDFNPRDPRNYLMFTASRSVRAHDQQ